MAIWAYTADTPPQEVANRRFMYIGFLHSVSVPYSPARRGVLSSTLPNYRTPAWNRTTAPRLTVVPCGSPVRGLRCAAASTPGLITVGQKIGSTQRLMATWAYTADKTTGWQEE